MENTASLLESARRTITMERDAIEALLPRIGDSFAHACRLILECRGRVVVTGMGKSGHIGSKIAATLASTGTPAFFVHPGEASHGDLGMITGDDVVIAISNSGNTGELVTILPLIKRRGAALVSMAGKEDSQLARLSHANLDIGVEQEACPMGLAPHPAQPSPSSWAMRWRLPSWRPAASAPRILRSTIRAAPWVAACCSKSPT